MPIFKDTDGTLKKLKSIPLAKERTLQRLIEQNLMEILDMRFIASEYPTTSRGRIDTLAIDVNGAPVIIEYKLGKNENVITQSLSYLRWLKAQKVEFFEMLVRRKYPDSSAEELRIDWQNPRVICIAESYTKYDIDTVEVLPIRLELFKYRYYESGILSIESLTGIEQSEERVSITPNALMANDEPTSTTDHTIKAPEKIKDLYEELRSRIFQIDEGIIEKATTVYIAYSLQKNFAEIHIRKSKIAIHLRAIEYNDPKSKVETVPASYRWTLSKRVYIDNETELDYIMQLIEQSYNDVL